MAVDEKYVEKVGEEQVDYDEILKEFGVKAEFKEDSSGITVPGDYTQYRLNQLEVDEIYAGRPQFGNIEKIEWTDKSTGEKEVNYVVKLYVIDDSSEEAYIIPCNLKSKDTLQRDLYPTSKLYILQMGLLELKAPGISKSYNRLTVNIDNLRKKVNEMDYLYFRVTYVEKQDMSYYSFRVVSEEDI